MLNDLPFSGKNLDEMAEVLESREFFHKHELLEARGDIRSALEAIPRDGKPVLGIARARLHLRLGEDEEAARVLANFGKRQEILAWSIGETVHEVRRACGPLEIAGEWDLAGRLLRLIARALPAAAWTSAVWAEEIDIAYHRGRIDETLAEARKEDPVRHAFFHERLGNAGEADKILIDFVKTATPEEIARALECLDNPILLQALGQAWSDKSAASPGLRSRLFSAVAGSGFDEATDTLLIEWLDGNPPPEDIAEILWPRWLHRPLETPSRTKALEALHRKYPEDPRFALLFRRQIRNEMPDHAVGLLEQAAREPFRSLPGTDPQIWKVWNTPVRRRIPAEAETDLPYLAFFGLGSMDRQDRIDAIIGSRPEFKELPLEDQLRYLAAGRMDRPFVQALLAADFSLPESNRLAAWLYHLLPPRSGERRIPIDVEEAIVRHLTELTLGSAGKQDDSIRADSYWMLNLINESRVGPDLMHAELRRWDQALKTRSEALHRSIRRNHDWMLKRYPAFKGALEPLDEVAPDPAQNARAESVHLIAAAIPLFSPPDIARLPPPKGVFDDHSLHMIHPNLGSVAGLHRWHQGLESSTTAFLIRPKRENGRTAPIGAFMKRFQPGHPRRLPVDLMVAAKLIDPDDPELAGQAAKVREDLLSGALEMPGTLLYRIREMAGAGNGKIPGEIVAEFANEPASVRRAMFAPSGSLVRLPPVWIQALRKHLPANEPTPRSSVPTRIVTSPPDEQERLLQASDQRSPTEETLGLARRILIRAAGAPSSVSERSLQAAKNTIRSGHATDAVMKDIREKLEADGLPEIAILRAQERVDPGSSVYPRRKTKSYPRRIFELDPDDPEAASTVLGEAIHERDRDLALRCFTTVAKHDPRMAVLAASNPDFVGMIDEAFGGNLVSSLITRSPNNVDPNGISTLHERLLGVSPESAARLRDWYRPSLPAGTNLHLRLALQLAEAGDSDAAAEWIAARHLPRPGHPGAPWAFPPAHPYSGDAGLKADLREDIDLLERFGLHGRVLALLEKNGAAPEAIVVTLRLATVTTLEEFHRLVTPYLGKLENTKAQLTLHLWDEILGDDPRSHAWMPALLQMKIDRSGTGDPVKFELRNAIARAARFPGSGASIAIWWKALRKNHEEHPEDKSYQSLMLGLFPSICAAADEPTWKDYRDWFTGHAADPWKPPVPFLRELDPTGIPVSRLVEIMPAILPTLLSEESRVNHLLWVEPVLRHCNREAQEKFLETLPQDDFQLPRIMRLGMGIESEATPSVWSIPLGDGRHAVSWSLGSLPGDRSRPQEPRVAGVDFSALDGSFDLRILAGTTGDRLSTVARLPRASATGTETLRFPPGAKVIALMAERHGGDEIRWTDAIPLSEGPTEPVNLAGKATSPGVLVTASPEGGPGNAPVREFRSSTKTTFDAAGFDWNGSEEVEFTAWISGSGSLSLHAFDHAGGKVGSRSVATHGSPHPIWRQVRLKWPPDDPSGARATRITLTVEIDPNRQFRSGNLRISGLFLSKRPMTDLPTENRRIFRLPGDVVALVRAPEGDDLLIATRDGEVVLLDPEKEKAIWRQTLPLDRRTRVDAIQWKGPSIFAITNDRSVHRFSPQTGDRQLILPPTPSDERRDNFSISPDGRHAVWLRAEDRRGVLQSLGSLPLPAPRTFADSLRSCHFAEDGALILLPSFDPGFQRLPPGEFKRGDPRKAGESDEIPADHSSRNLMKSELMKYSPRNINSGREQLELRLPGDTRTISLPTSPGKLATSPDGTLYFADRFGGIYRCTP